MRHTADTRHAPFILIWEVTRACSLACRHCRAEADDRRHPDELDLPEGRDLIDQVAAMGTRILVFTGGDPLQREDLEELVVHAKSRGLRVGLIPAVSERLSHQRITSLAAAGVDQLALSIDAAEAGAHDRFRGIPGTFERALAAAAWVHEAGIPLQVNSVFSRQNLDHFQALAYLVNRLEAVFWEIFALVPMGRGTQLEALKPADYRVLFSRIYQLQPLVPFIIKVAEAPQYRAYVCQREASNPSNRISRAKRIRQRLGRPDGPGGSIGQAPQAINSGKGFLFIDHVGGVHPSGFLPLKVGDVRHSPLEAIYREAPLLRALRNPKRLGGRCGRCAYSRLCGGSRARAYTRCADPLAEDQDCDLWQAPLATASPRTR